MIDIRSVPANHRQNYNAIIMWKSSLIKIALTCYGLNYLLYNCGIHEKLGILSINIHS